VVFEGNAVVWAEEPGSLTALWKQRLRWARGNVQISMQYLSLWGRQRRFAGRLGDPPFFLLWFTVLLMPLLVIAECLSLLVLFTIGEPFVWPLFRVLWMAHALAYVFGTTIVLATDTATARRSWREAILFPGVISLAIMIYSVFPAAIEVNGARLLAHAGLVAGPGVRTGFALFIYTWLMACIVLAWLAKAASETRGLRWLAPITIYLAGYGSFLIAVTFASYVTELRSLPAVWEKTEKVGRVTLGAAPR